MNLQQWIATDHASVLSRFDSAIAAHVPLEQWKRSGSLSEPSPSIAWLLFILIMVLTAVQLRLQRKWVHYDA